MTIDHKVVDETCLRKADREQRDAWTFHRLQRLEGTGMAHGHIINRGGGSLLDHPTHPLRQPSGIPLPPPDLISGPPEGPVHPRGLPPLTRREIDVARGHGKPIRLPDGGQHDHLDIHIEIPDHARDDARLLVILLAKVGAVRFHDMEKLRHDRRYSPEVPGAGRAFPPARESLDLDEGRVPVRIYALLLRDEDEIGPLGGRLGEIPFEINRIILQILLPAKLGRVDKDAHRQDGVVAAGGGGRGGGGGGMVDPFGEGGRGIAPCRQGTPRPPHDPPPTGFGVAPPTPSLAPAPPDLVPLPTPPVELLLPPPDLPVIEA